MKLDFDENGALDFTQNNIDLINFCIKVDSSYRNAFSEDYVGSSAELIKKHWEFNAIRITEICKLIDKENSTHLAVSGHKKNLIKYDKINNENNQGVAIVVDRIMSISNIIERIENINLDLVNEIASSVKGISKFSFASKFCTYVSRYKFGNMDGYSIYDSVISEILPYYEWKFLSNTKVHARIKNNKEKNIASTIENSFANKDKFDYNGYNTLIGQIIKAINEKKGLNIDRLTFDRLLWYYYKGDEKLRKSVLSKIPLECI